MTTRIDSVEFGYNVTSSEVVARNVTEAMSKARDFIMTRARKENRNKDAVFYAKLQVTKVELVVESDN